MILKARLARQGGPFYFQGSMMKLSLLWFGKYRRQRAAATGVEYALMAAGISLTIMGAVFFFGDTIQETFTIMFETLVTYLQDAG